MDNLLVHLHRFIDEHYDLEDFRTVCFYLGTDYDNLAGEGKASKARALLLYLGRQHRLDELLDVLSQTRPKLIEQSGLRTDPAALEVLYSALFAFEVDDKRRLDELDHDYRAKLASKYELITIQGISPKVGNQTIGIRMEDIFIPLCAIGEDPGVLKGLPEQSYDHRSLNRIVQLLTQLFDLEELRALAFDFGIGNAHIDGHTKRDWARGLVTFAERYQNVTALVEAIKRWRPAMRKPDKPVTLKSLLDLPRAVIQGDPGSGKSTLTRYVAWAIARERTELIGEGPTARLPIRVRAIELGEALEGGRVDRLDTFLAREAGRFAPLLRYALVAGKALVMIDGLDEVGVPALRARVKEQVDDFVADPAYAENQILLTTRTVGYERSGLSGSFPHFTLAELDDEQIARFVQCWYRAIYAPMPDNDEGEKESRQLLDTITSNAGIQRLARNPLLLTIIALIKWQGRALPDKRVLLYNAATQTLIRSWPLMQRQVELDELLIREWLAPVAFRVFRDGVSDLIDEPTLMKELVDSMRRLKPMTKFEARQASQALLKDVSQHSGILLPRGTDADGRNLYGFLHQTFAEYLTAYHLVGCWEDGNLDLRAYAYDPYWREVLLLMAGHLGTQRRAKAGRFIQAIRDLNSSPYEAVIHRDLLLAGRILAEGVPAGQGSWVESLLRELLLVWRETPLSLLRDDIEELLKRLADTEYAPVLARLARDLELDKSQTLLLAQLLGPDYFRDSLEALLQSHTPQIRLQAAEKLASQNGSVVTAALALLLGADDPWVRLKASQLLAAQGDPRGLAGVVALLGHQHPGVDLGAVGWLAEQDDPRIESALMPLLSDVDPQVRYGAAQLLAERDLPQGKWVLVSLLEDENSRVRYQSARLLARQDDPQGVPALIELLNARDSQVRLQAVWALDEHDHPQIVPALRAMLNDRELGVRLQAARALAQRDDPVGVSALVISLDDADPEVRLQAAEWLAQRDDERGVSTLMALLSADESECRLEAARALTKLGDPQGMSALVELLDDEKASVRFEATERLARHNDALAFDTLRQRLERMLAATDVVNKHASPGEPRSVADIAYRFLRQHLTPSGELERVIEAV